MQYRDFTKAVQEALGGTATEQAAKLAIDAVSRALTDGLAEQGEVRLSGFGNFRLRRYANRRRPGSDAPAAVGDWMRLSFTPSRSSVLPAHAEDREKIPRSNSAATPTPSA